MSARRKIGDRVLAHKLYEVTIIDAPINKPPQKCYANRIKCPECGYVRITSCDDPDCKNWYTDERGYVCECQMSDLPSKKERKKNV